MIVVSKESIRGLVKLHRLPSTIRMVVAGCWLYDVLAANSLEKKFRLMNPSYRVTARSLNDKQMRITWRVV